MTLKIERFIAEQAPATPCLVFDVDRVEDNFHAFCAALPLAQVYYAVKANPAAPILARLVALGCRFDAASFEEIEMVLAAGAGADRISFGNTIKKSVAIRRAYEAGVRLYAFDSEAELRKIAEHAPGSRVFCRIIVGNEGACWPLSRKFGTSPDMAHELLVLAGSLGLEAWGVSFHVGSQQTSPEAHEAAIGRAALLFDDLAEAGVKLEMINIGGGFPSQYRDHAPEIDHFATGIMHALTFHFGNELPLLVAEPGRYFVADAGVIRSEVVLVSRKTRDDPVRWVYIDIGRFGGLSETEGEAIHFTITADRPEGPVGPVVLAGPTCDSADTLYERDHYQMPLSLRDGDQLTIHTTGAYTTTYATQNFNGFKPMTEHYI